jgi:hypothetical protein
VLASCGNTFIEIFGSTIKEGKRKWSGINHMQGSTDDSILLYMFLPVLLVRCSPEATCEEEGSPDNIADE